MKRIAIIGAGISGLAAARELKANGKDVVIYEKSRAVGGRIATRRHENLVFDHGAQNIKSAGTALDAVARAILKEEDFTEITAPVCLHDGADILPGDASSNSERKWSYNGGMTRLAKALAAEHEIRFSVRIAQLRETKSHIALHDESGAEVGVADAVIVTAPAGQAADLLQNSELLQDATARIKLLRTATYSNCLSIMLHYQMALEAQWYALLAQDRTHPLLWLARENAKGRRFVPDRAGTSLVAQTGPEWSSAHYDDSDESIVAHCGEWIAPLLGKDFRTPHWSSIKRWRYSQPQKTLDFASVNSSGSRVIICGDATTRGRVPDAFDSGLLAAAMFGGS
jgi:predicted NAD/FAD-dependent oxidoreductase